MEINLITAFLSGILVCFIVGLFIHILLKLKEYGIKLKGHEQTLEAIDENVNYNRLDAKEVEKDLLDLHRQTHERISTLEELIKSQKQIIM